MTVKIRPSYLRLVRAERHPLDLRIAQTPKVTAADAMDIRRKLAAKVRRETR